MIVFGLILAIDSYEKKDVELNILSNSSLEKEDCIEVQLSTLDNESVGDKTIYMEFTDDDGVYHEYSVINDQDGIALFKLEDIDPGNYSVNFIFKGDDKYNSTNITQKIQIKGKVDEKPATQQTSTESSGSSSSSSSLNYNEKYNFYYNDEGIVVDPNGHYSDIAGRSYDDVLAEAEYIDEHGLL